MKNSKYYICSNCQNITISTGEAKISCCGKILTPLTPVKAAEEQKLTIDIAEDEWYITSRHTMTKEHYISFVAFAASDRIEIIKQYPEWNLELRIQRRGHGMLIWYSLEHGLLYQLL
jgi:hypothetical protein